MLSVSSAQLDAWMAALMFPLVRLLGLAMAAPIFSNRGVPVRIRLAIGIGIALAVLPALPPMPAVAPGSGLGLAILAQQMFIGIAVGLMVRLVLGAVDLAGAMIAMQMGLSFAMFFDQDAGGQTSVVSDFLNYVALMLLLAMNGHLMMVQVLVHSFEWLPVSLTPVNALGWGYVARTGATVFATGLLLSLPVVAILLVSSIALGVLTRAAPQLNLFAVGFPITLSAGMIGIVLVMSSYGPVVQSFFERSFDDIGRMIEALAPLATP